MAEMRAFCDGAEAYIKAAPTVRCEECGLRATCLIPEYAIAGPDFGCSYFERREP